MMQPSTAAGGVRARGWPFLALLLVVAFTYASSIYANLSFAVSNGENFRLLPPFKPHVNENMNEHLGAEYFNVARSLTRGEGFANPFLEPTGPTAWMPPVLCMIEAGLLWVCDNDKFLVTVLVVFLQVNVLIATGLLVLALIWQTTRRGWPLVAAAVFCLALLWDFHSHFQFTHDSWLILLTIDVLVAGHCWFQPMGSRVRATFWGLFGGLCALVNPIVAMTWIFLSTVLGVRRRAWACLVLAGAMAICVIAPWTVRNYAVFGHWIPVKSNLAYELYQSQCLQPEGLLRHTTFGQHPYVSAGRERFEYKTEGEISFLERKRKQFWDAVSADPADFLNRAAQRFLGATLWYEPFKREERTERPIVFMLGRLIHPLPFLGFLILLFASVFRPLAPVQWIVIGIYVLYLSPYIGISYYERYAVPLLGIKVLLVIWAADRLLSLLRYAWKRPAFEQRPASQRLEKLAAS